MLLRLDDARETKQGVEFRLAAAEGNEIVDRVTARAALENFLQVASPCFGVENAFFFKGAEAVRRAGGAGGLSPDAQCGCGGDAEGDA